MVISIGVSLIWLTLGTYFSAKAGSYAFAGIEPFYPGLLVSLIFWVIGRARHKDVLEETEFSKKEM